MSKPDPDKKPDDTPAFRNDAYRAYMREYMKEYRAKKRAESLRHKPAEPEAKQ